jgi:hypothetical protein
MLDCRALRRGRISTRLSDLEWLTPWDLSCVLILPIAFQSLTDSGYLISGSCRLVRIHFGSFLIDTDATSM